MSNSQTLDVASIDGLTHKLYNSPTPEHQSECLSQLSSFSSDSQQLVELLKASSSPFTHFFVAQQLQQGIMKNKSTLAHEQLAHVASVLTLGVINYNTEDNTNNFAFKMLVNTLCRTVKLTYETAHHLVEVAESFTGLIRSNILAEGSTISVNDHRAILRGIRLLSELVKEMGTYDNSRSNTFMGYPAHRRASNNFKETSLLDIFLTSMQVLSAIASGAIAVNSANEQLINGAGALISDILQYDFAALTIDETEEQLASQLPLAWREPIYKHHGDVYTAFVELPIPLCTALAPGVGALCSTRRSFFEANDDRMQWMERFFTVLCTDSVISEQRLNDENYRYQFASIISRIVPPANYKEVMQCPSGMNFLRTVGKLTAMYARHDPTDDRSMACMSLLLTFWQRLVNSKVIQGTTHNQTPEQQQQEDEIGRIGQDLIMAFVTTRAQTPDSQVQSDELDVESIPGLCDSIAIVTRLGPTSICLAIKDYIVSASSQIGTYGMTWVTSIVGAIAKYYGTSVRQIEEVQCDLITLLLQFIERRRQEFFDSGGYMSPRASSKLSAAETNLELAIILFIDNLRASFFRQNLSDSVKKAISYIGFHDVKKFQTFILLCCAKALQQYRDPVLAETTIKALYEICDSLHMYSPYYQVYSRQSGHADTPPISTNTPLDISCDITRLPIAMDPENLKLRKGIYAVLFALNVFDYFTTALFNQFMEPLDRRLHEAINSSSDTQILIAAWARDMHGVIERCYTKETFNALFSWLYTARGQQFEKMASLATSPLAAIAMLRMVQGLARSAKRNPRASDFEGHSPNGLLLFKGIAAVVQTILAARFNSQENITPQNVYQCRCKPLALCFTIIQEALDGGFCPFGAMKVYGDSTLHTTINGLISLLLNFDIDQILAHKKLVSAVINLVKACCHDHLFVDLLIAGDSNAFSSICELMCATLRHDTAEVSLVSSSCEIIAFLGRTSMNIDDILGIRDALQKQFNTHQHIIPNLFEAIMDVVIFQEKALVASASALLPLILVYEDNIRRYEERWKQSVLPDKVDHVARSFMGLMVDVKLNLKASNVDQFTRNLTEFRKQMKTVAQ